MPGFVLPYKPEQFLYVATRIKQPDPHLQRRKSVVESPMVDLVYACFRPLPVSDLESRDELQSQSRNGWNPRMLELRAGSQKPMHTR
jgi:hypothetical protein